TSRWGVAPADARLLAHLAAGRPGWAVQAARDPGLLAGRRRQLDLLYEALGQARVGRFALAETLARDAEALPDMLRLWAGWWRDAALLSAGRAEGVDSPGLLNVDEIGRLAELSAAWPWPRILASLKGTRAATGQLGRNANIRLVLENLLLTYPAAP
ncbi:MAG: hypothetical protein ACRDHL_03490, partial [Candidatus Promineifilaceae bacterium]